MKTDLKFGFFKKKLVENGWVQHVSKRWLRLSKPRTNYFKINNFETGKAEIHLFRHCFH